MSQKTKFRISIEKLEFEFEGDRDEGQRFQAGINRTLGSIAELQSSAMGTLAAAPTGTGVVVDAEPVQRRRRRRRSRAEGNQEAQGESGETADGTDAEAGTRASRRPEAGVARVQLLRLRSEGYFAAYRTLGDIRERLRQLGHMFTAQDLSPVLLRLTKSQALVRDKRDNQWAYMKGPFDEVE